MVTTGELRKELARLLIQVRDGKLTGEQIRGVVGVANQITASMSVEMRARHAAEKIGDQVLAFGDMRIDGSPPSRDKR
jgi:hypothetical protein